MTDYKLMPALELARHQPCGCIVCYCEHETQCQGCGAKHCGTHPVGQFPAPAYLQPEPDVKQDDYETWYEEAIIASNNAGFAGMSAAQVIEYQDGEIKCLRTGVDVLVKALELISNTDPDEGTAWFHEVAHKALAAYRNQVEPSDDNK